jgi:cupin 2 domain-containing protein
MTVNSGSLFSNIPAALRDEQIESLLSRADIRVERIVSKGQSSPVGFWYDQDWSEWVVVLAGSAGVLIEGEAAPRVLNSGHYIDIPAHVRHRVEWTDAEQPTIWLAVHYR